jgi:hypothetical protein
MINSKKTVKQQWLSVHEFVSMCVCVCVCVLVTFRKGGQRKICSEKPAIQRRRVRSIANKVRKCGVPGA